MSESTAKAAITLRPIGVVRTPYSRNWAPDQPVEQDAPAGKFRIVLDERYVEGLARLDLFAYIYVVTYLNRAPGEVPLTVSPPWAKGEKAGLFATRAPARPNPIGLHVVKLKAIDGNTLHIWPIDTYDQTPVLDVKPYIRDLDSKEDADYGWLNTFEGVRHLLEHIRGLPHSHDHDHDHDHEHERAHDHKHDHGHED